MTTHTLPLTNMTCGSCAARVDAALRKVPGLQGIRVNYANATAQFETAEVQPARAAVTALAEAGYPAEQAQVSFDIAGMSCGACSARLDKALRDAPGVVAAQVNLTAQTAQVDYIPGLTDPAALAQVAAATGYPATRRGAEVGQTDSGARHAEEAARQRGRFLGAAALALPVFLLEMGGHVIPGWHEMVMQTFGQALSWSVQFVLTTVLLLGPGRAFFTQGFAALARRAPNMNSLVALGAGAAWSYSTVALLAPGLLPAGSAVVYFEAAAVIVTLILMGRWFEARAKGQAGAAIARLIDLQPDMALVQRGGDWVETPTAEVHPGDVIRIAPGARVPTDATVSEGDSRIDESMITGEPMPVRKQPGDPVTGGSVNGNGSLICTVSRVGADTTLARIVDMVAQAQNARLPVQALVDRVTLWFVPAVLAVALATLAVWLIFGPSLSHALVAGVSVLIIACPCAMGLATPTSIMVGTGRAAELGVLFRQGDALQTLGGVDVVAFDKTGTLTEGRPKLTTFDVAEGRDAEETLTLIAGLEAQSEHSIARAVVEAAAQQNAPLPETRAYAALPGQGARAEVAGRQVLVGNADLMQEQGIDIAAFDADPLETAGQTVFFAAIDGAPAAMLAVSDPVRADAAQAIAALTSRGIKVAMITGDAEATAQAVARDLGIDTVTAGVRPDGKVAALQSLGKDGARVGFVGDGINDAPVLAAADVGIAVGSGTDVAIETADVVLMSGGPGAVLSAIDLSRLTLRNIKQNLVWAFGYNVALIPVAAGVLFPAFGWMLSPGLAAGAMAASSVLVLLNALRLKRAGGVA